MNEFWQTFLIATIPSAITALLSFFCFMENVKYTDKNYKGAK